MSHPRNNSAYSVEEKLQRSSRRRSSIQTGWLWKEAEVRAKGRKVKVILREKGKKAIIHKCEELDWCLCCAGGCKSCFTGKQCC